MQVGWDMDPFLPLLKILHSSCRRPEQVHKVFLVSLLVLPLRAPKLLLAPRCRRTSDQAFLQDDYIFHTPLPGPLVPQELSPNNLVTGKHHLSIQSLWMRGPY